MAKINLKAKQRNSGIEFLRIICILSIIFHHYYEHGGFPVFGVKDLSYSTVYLQCISMFGRAACSVFAIITGYYLINSEGGGTRQRIVRVMPIMIKSHIYSILLLIVVWITGIISISVSDLLTFLFPLLWGPWYIIFYILLFLLHPYLNILLIRIEKINYRKLLIGILVIWSVIPTLVNDAIKFSFIDFFIVMYLYGAYIQLYGIRFLEKNAFKTLILSTIFMILSVMILDLLGYYFGVDKFVNAATYFKKFNSILSFIWALSIFIVFKNINFYNKIINHIASSVVGIYILHDNVVFRKVIFQTISPNILYIDDPYGHSVIKVALIFLVSLAIDIVYRSLEYGIKQIYLKRME